MYVHHAGMGMRLTKLAGAYMSANAFKVVFPTIVESHPKSHNAVMHMYSC